MEDFAWESYFSWQSSPFYGRVLDVEDANDLIREFSYSTSTSFVVTRSSRNFGNFSFGECNSEHLLRFSDDGRVQRGSQITCDGVPFMVVGSKLMECHQGPNHRKSTELNKTKASDHLYSQAANKKKVTGTKKKGCKAAIFLREVVFFPEYKPPNDTAYWREMKSSELRRDLYSEVYEEINFQKYIYIDLPQHEQHTEHIMGMAADVKAPIDQRLVDKLNSLVEEGVYSVKEMQRHLKIFVKELFGKGEMPKMFNRRFFPSKDDIQKLIYRKRRNLLHSFIDQENLIKKVEEWKKESSDDFWHVRTSATVKKFISEDEDNNNGSIIKDEDQSLLVVFQTSWQKRLLLRYGSEVVFLDATYRTTKYALPLFFLCVHTNTGYTVVGTFVIETENANSVAEALAIIKENCPGWNSASFMVDSSEIEANAIKLVFPDTSIFICDFHRKQAWQRWTSTIKNDVENQEATLAMLNRVAESFNEKEYQDNLNHLMENTLWKRQPKLQDYIMKQWLLNDKYKSWVWAYRNSALTLVVHTNNGVEAQNKVFKYEYLAPFRVKTLSNLMTVLTQDFFVDAYRKYLASNVTMSAGWREPNESIPPELAHKPFHLIKHLRETAMKATSITPEMIKVINSNTVEVTSSNKSDRYKVFLGSENQQPSCQCREFQRSHLLCKHFCAIFKHVDNFSWNSLPDIYKTTPQFIIDTDCANIFPLPNTDQRELQYEEAQQIPDDEQGPEQEPSLTTLDLQRSAKKFREELHRLNNLSYIVDSVEKLDRFRDQLHEMANELTRGCPTSGGLLLEPEQKERKKPASVNRTGHVLKDLPSKRKRKLQVSSVKGRKLKQQTPQVLGLKTNQSNEHDENIPDVNPVKKIKLSSHDKRQNKDDGQTPGKKVKFNFRRTTPQLNIKAKSLGKQQNSSRAEEQKLEEIEIRPLLIEYMKTIREHDWENIIVKGNYVGTNLAGRRAGAALEMVKEDGGQLLKDVKNYMPKKFHVSDLCLVEILFMLMARMVNDDVIKLKVDPKDTDKKAQQAIKELLQCLKDSKQPSDVPSCSSIKNSLFATECEENFIKSLKEEGLLKTSTYMLVKNSSVRYEVQGETLEGKDLRTLQESRWLNDKVMNAYMGILKKENNMEQDGHVFVFPSYMAVLWEQNRFDTWFYRKVSLSQYTWIFQPINKCQNHWILLAAHVPEMSVSILDSMAGSNDKYIANWRKYMKMRSAEVGELSGEWTNGKLQSSRQKDGNSCGPFVLMNALALSKGIEPTILSQRSALVMREHVTCKLIQAAKEPKAQRTICDMLVCKKPSKDSWVQCEVCGRWLHFTCIGVKNAPDNDYVCIICNAQYK